MFHERYCLLLSYDQDAVLADRRPVRVLSVGRWDRASARHAQRILAPRSYQNLTAAKIQLSLDQPGFIILTLGYLGIPGGQGSESAVLQVHEQVYSITTSKTGEVKVHHELRSNGSAIYLKKRSRWFSVTSHLMARTGPRVWLHEHKRVKLQTSTA